jgi:hydrogenase maturation protease
MRIVGCGNRERGDDAVGLFVVDRLRELGAKAENYSGDPLGLMHLWSRGDDVLLVDAVVTGAPPGAIYLWDGLQQHIAGSCPTSSHGLDIVQAIELARALDRLPRQLRICGIEAREFSVGAKITKPVQQAGKAVLKAILKECLEVSPSGPLRKRDRRSGLARRAHRNRN